MTIKLLILLLGLITGDCVCAWRGWFSMTWDRVLNDAAVQAFTIIAVWVVLVVLQ